MTMDDKQRGGISIEVHTALRGEFYVARFPAWPGPGCPEFFSRDQWLAMAYALEWLASEFRKPRTTLTDGPHE